MKWPDFAGAFRREFRVGRDSARGEGDDAPDGDRDLTSIHMSPSVAACIAVVVAIIIVLVVLFASRRRRRDTAPGGREREGARGGRDDDSSRDTAALTPRRAARKAGRSPEPDYDPADFGMEAIIAEQVQRRVSAAAARSEDHQASWDEEMLRVAGVSDAPAASPASPARGLTLRELQKTHEEEGGEVGEDSPDEDEYLSPDSSELRITRRGVSTAVPRGPSRVHQAYDHPGTAFEN